MRHLAIIMRAMHACPACVSMHASPACVPCVRALHLRSTMPTIHLGNRVTIEPVQPPLLRLLLTIPRLLLPMPLLLLPMPRLLLPMPLLLLPMQLLLLPLPLLLLPLPLLPLHLPLATLTTGLHRGPYPDQAAAFKGIAAWAESASQEKRIRAARLRMEFQAKLNKRVRAGEITEADADDELKKSAAS